MDNTFEFNNLQMEMPNYNNLIKPAIPQEVKDALDEVNLHKYQARQAQIDAADDISEMKGHMSDLIENQKMQIENQKKQIERQEKTIDQLQTLNETQSQQLQRLKEIFYSIEDGTAVSKEMMRDLEELLVKQPGWKEFMADKGADLVVGGFIAAIPTFLKMLGLL